MPCTIKLEAGVHWWCSCARSGHQPLCDGSHTGTGKGPVKFTVAEGREVVLCTCKHTDHPPWCDGSHGKRVEESED